MADQTTPPAPPEPWGRGDRVRSVHDSCKFGVVVEGGPQQTVVRWNNSTTPLVCRNAELRRVVDRPSRKAAMPDNRSG